MLKRTLSILIIITLSLLTLCSCGDDDDVAFVVPIKNDPMCLDPQIVESDEAKLIVANCYEGLVRMNENYEIIPGVAKEWSISADGLTYTFKLRDDTNWQLLKAYSKVLDDENYMDNFKTKVTAHDFEFALKRVVDPITDSKDANKLYCIKNAEAIHSGDINIESLGVKAVDDSTLTITLTNANPDFLRILTLPACMPCNEEFFNATHAKYGLALEYTFCNGPFYLGRWAEDHSLVMYRNNGYKGETKVNPVAVYFNINEDDESILKKLKQNSYDCAYITNKSHIALSDSNKFNELFSLRTTLGLCFNCKDASLSNINLRKALIMMTKSDIISKADTAISATAGIVPDCCRIGSESYRQTVGSIDSLAYNENTAVELWKKGLDELESESVSVTISCTEEYSADMQRAIQIWQRLLGTGIIAKVEILTDDELKKKIKDDTYQIAISSITTDSSTVSDTLEIFTTKSKSNIFNYSNAEYDAAVASIINGIGNTELINACYNAEKALVNNAVFRPLYSYADYIAVNADVTGLYASPALDCIYFLNGGRK